MSRERGQAQIEAVVLVLLVLVGAGTIGLAAAAVRGVLVADAAAHSAGVAALTGGDPAEAARAALPRERRRAARVGGRDGEIVVRLPLSIGSGRAVRSRVWAPGP